MDWRKIALGVACLLMGCAIYLVLRKDTIHLYRWWHAIVGTGALESLRETARSWQVPECVRYSLPDGLYCLSYILITDGLLNGEKGFWRHAIVCLIPTVAITHECLQAAGLARGTFDWVDVVCYALPPTAYFLYMRMRENH